MLKSKLHKTLYTAIENGDLSRVSSLLKNKGIETAILDYDNNTPLHIAAYYNQTDIVKLLLHSGLTPEDIKKANEYGQTALAYAAENKNKDLIELLIDAMQLAYDQMKALIITCIQNKYNDVAKALITRLSDEQLQSPDEDGCTLLMHAAKYANSVVAKAIITRVTNEQCAVKDSNGQTALMHAARSGSTALGSVNKN